MSEDSADRQAKRLYSRFLIGAVAVVLVCGTVAAFFFPLAYVATVVGVTLVFLRARAEVVKRRVSGRLSARRTRLAIVLVDVLWAALVLWGTSLYFPRP